MLEKIKVFLKKRKLIVWIYEGFFKLLWKVGPYFRKIRLQLGFYTENEKMILKFKNMYKGQTCVVVGNGPSLRVEDLERLKKKGYIFFGSNKIYKIFGQTSWRPDFYACTDTLVYEQNEEEIRAFVECPRFFRQAIRYNCKMWDEQKDMFVWYYEYKKGKIFSNDSLIINSGGTVTYVLLALAYMMGFQTVFLIGCDNTYGFYEQKDKKSGMVEVDKNINNDYFIKDYMRAGEKMNIGNMEYVEEGYKRAKKKYEQTGRKIYNITRGGKLEVFERIDIDDIV